MQEHLRRLPLLGSRVLVLAPEDVLAHKALLLLRGDGPLAKGHRQDLEAIIRIQGANLELEYLCRRLELCQAPPDVRTLLIQKGLALPDS